jgi:hypothetical protein
MQTTDKQVRKLMQEYQKTGNKSISALKAGMSRKTAGKYLSIGKTPGELKTSRNWRTHQDPFKAHWPEMKEMLENAPELEGKILFDFLCECHPECYQEGQLRTFQRRIREWRALEGPDKVIFFPQNHEPGRIMATDFTHMDCLNITIDRVPFNHMLCHSVLTYSNWEWGEICHSESMVALKKGMQSTLIHLGHIPEQHLTDHSTAATHVIKKKEPSKKWTFNDKYIDFMNHYHMEPRTIQVGEPNENGDIESMNGVLKRRVNQYLLIRGNREFENIEQYRLFLEDIMDKGNRNRQNRLDEELAVMRALDVDPLPEYYEENPRVTKWSTISIRKIPYSVPSRLKGEKVKANVYEDRIDVYFHNVYQLTMPRITGDEKHHINYRHIISGLIKKPGAFRRYLYRADLFPTTLFRWAYDSLCDVCSERVADIEYLRILQKAAQTMECQVGETLAKIKEQGMIPRWNIVLEYLPAIDIEVPAMESLEVNLNEYDFLFTSDVEVAK